jgi:iron-sulfur cluster assembly protein
MTASPRMNIITLTDKAAERIKALTARSEAPGAGLRLGVKKGGCAGMEYTMTLAEAANPGEEIVEDKGAIVFVEPQAVLYLIGTQMDYQTDKLKSGFVFSNPNQVSACGCGESVTLKPASS